MRNKRTFLVEWGYCLCVFVCVFVVHMIMKHISKIDWIDFDRTLSHARTHSKSIIHRWDRLRKSLTIHKNHPSWNLKIISWRTEEKKNHINRWYRNSKAIETIVRLPKWQIHISNPSSKKKTKMYFCNFLTFGLVFKTFLLAKNLINLKSWFRVDFVVVLELTQFNKIN